MCPARMVRIFLLVVVGDVVDSGLLVPVLVQFGKEELLGDEPGRVWGQSPERELDLAAHSQRFHEMGGFMELPGVVVNEGETQPRLQELVEHRACVWREIFLAFVEVEEIGPLASHSLPGYM